MRGGPFSARRISVPVTGDDDQRGRPDTVGTVGKAIGRLVVIAGPTGTGKSDLSLELADRLDGEVVNADSMQLYRGMDIGTAKLTPDQRGGIPHHLLDVLDIDAPASVAAYQRHARNAIEGILARDRTPILVGGSGLYVNAVIDEMAFPATDPAVRFRWETELAQQGAAVLHARLVGLDPAAAAAIEPGNGRRLVRALEVIELTGAPFSATLPVPGPPRYDAALFLVDRPVDELDQRLAERVTAMVGAGLAGEVAQLADRGLRTAPTAARALGYRQFLEVLDGRSTEAAATAATLTATRRFVRRQRSWFGRDRRAVAVPAGRTGTVPAVLAVLTGRTGTTGFQA